MVRRKRRRRGGWKFSSWLGVLGFCVEVVYCKRVGLKVMKEEKKAVWMIGSVRDVIWIDGVGVCFKR